MKNKNNYIEVEVRCLLDEKEYKRLVRFFGKNAKLLWVRDDESRYYKSPLNLRIQKTSQSAKIWAKTGRMHDSAREEIEISIDRKSFEKTHLLFEKLGFPMYVTWIRKRRMYQWGDITVALDNTKGYGYKLELEMMSDSRNKKSTLTRLEAALKELGVTKTPEGEFDRKFNEYVQNWKKLVKQSTNT